MTYVTKWLGGLGLAFGLVMPSYAEEGKAAVSLTPEQTTQLAKINAILKGHPQIIGDLSKSLEAYVAQLKQVEVALKEQRSWLTQAPEHSKSGAENPALTIINFTDYNCPYCKRLEIGLAKLLIEIDNVKVVNIYVPLQQQIASGTNTNSAFYALKVWEKEPEKFAEVHRLLVAHPTRHDAESLNRIAKETGTEKYLETGEREESIVSRNMQAFGQLGLRGTPALIINDEIVPGFLPYGELKKAVQKELN
ncbi:DsbA family protein [Vibrio penaeicida]|uniref:Outer membrane protein n=1 Tax=Vibrio penaeicida TaxID=104609 RepID=A0AAV5P2C3_9VIBR|nr:DsbA family protein [Vibrio penaeicida]GLQ76036.1 outer membrane protein [Vibrio penaeicida]